MRFEPWVKSTTALKTWRDFYGVGLRAVKEYKPLATARLDEITSETAAEFAAYRRSHGLQISSVNVSLRVLRRVLKIAVEWGALDRMPKVKLLPGERHRERVITPEEEARSLAAASPLLCDLAAVLFDTGLRREECYRLLWDSITWTNGRNGTLLVTHGEPQGQAHPRESVEARWRASRGLGLASTDQEQPR
jgi:integrase